MRKCKSRLYLLDITISLTPTEHYIKIDQKGIVKEGKISSPIMRSPSWIPLDCFASFPYLPFPAGNSTSTNGNAWWRFFYIICARRSRSLAFLLFHASWYCPILWISRVEFECRDRLYSHFSATHLLSVPCILKERKEEDLSAGSLAMLILMLGSHDSDYFFILKWKRRGMEGQRRGIGWNGGG